MVVDGRSQRRRSRGSSNSSSSSNLLPSICLGPSRSSNKYGGCVDVFLHLFDWNRRLSKSFVLGLGPPERAEHQHQHQQKQNKRCAKKGERLPMAKQLLMIADDETRNSCPPARVHSLQELLHRDKDEPAKLQELLTGSESSSAKRQQQQQHPEQNASPFFNLLMQDVKDPKRSNSTSEKSSSSSSSAASPGCTFLKSSSSSSSSSAASSGCTFLLEAATRLLAERRRQPAAIASSGAAKPEEELFGVKNRRLRRMASAPPLQQRMEQCSSSSSVRSLVEQLLDDLEEYDTLYGSGAASAGGAVREVHIRPSAAVPLNELDEQDYVSFRDFLTSSAAEATSSPMSSSPSSRSGSCSSPCSAPSRHAVDKHEFTLLQNPLFEEQQQQQQQHLPGSEPEDEDEEDRHGADQDGLEDILKSILSDNKPRITWSPEESYLFSKPLCCDENENESKSVDDNMTSSDSNCCSEDCQPSPVSVLDSSPFDDDAPRRKATSARKKLSFEDPPPLFETTAVEAAAAAPPAADINPSSLGESELEYANTVLRESGILHHQDALFLLLEPELIGSRLFDRLEDRLRVEELIRHLESYNSDCDSRHLASNMASLKSHYQSYHECRARRRLIFDYVAQVLAAVLEQVATKQRLDLFSGLDVAAEVESRLKQWRRELSTDQLAEKDVIGSKSFNSDEQVREAAFACERMIFNDLVEELANALLLQHCQS